jgi:hypothetical protein
VILDDVPQQNSTFALAFFGVKLHGANHLIQVNGW